MLPYRGDAYCEACGDMKQVAWITAHVNAYAFFGGVTRILVPDNLKTGLAKKHQDRADSEQNVSGNGGALRNSSCSREGAFSQG